MILVAIIFVWSLLQLQRWSRNYHALKDELSACMEASAEIWLADFEVKPVASSDDVHARDWSPLYKGEEACEDVEDGLLGGLWNLNSALHFGQDYEWMYKLSELDILDSADAGLANFYNQAASTFADLFAPILVKCAQFTAGDGCDVGEAVGAQETEEEGCRCQLESSLVDAYEDEFYGTPHCCGFASCICFEVDRADWRKVGLVDSFLEEGEEIASVEPPAVEWGQRKRDVEAEKQRRLDLDHGFSFCAAGLLFPYYLGVSDCLKEHGHIKEGTALAGSSAGALVCAVVAGGLSMRDSLEATKELGRECREGGTAFKLGAVLRVFLNKFLPEDAHLRCNGRIRVSITQLFGSPKGLLVDLFDSKEDLLDALLASCHIPLYFATWPVTLFRNRICLDGGLAFLMPPTSAKHTVRICAFPGLASLRLGEPQISPDSNPSSDRPSLFQLVRWALVPAEDHHMEQLFQLGYQDALLWCRKQQHISC